MYVTSSDYPYTTLVKETDCNCSISVTNNTFHAAGNTSALDITMAMIHTELEAGQQLSLMSSDGAFLRNFTQHTAKYVTSFEDLSYSELDLLWRSRRIGNNGRFWVGFQSK